MTRLLNTLAMALSRVWRHTSAAIAVLLIVAALFIGYRLGRPAPADVGTEMGTPSAATSGAPTMYTCSMHPAVRLPDPKAKCRSASWT